MAALSGHPDSVTASSAAQALASEIKRQFLGQADWKEATFDDGGIFEGALHLIGKDVEGVQIFANLKTVSRFSGRVKNLELYGSYLTAFVEKGQKITRVILERGLLTVLVFHEVPNLTSLPPSQEITVAKEGGEPMFWAQIFSSELFKHFEVEKSWFSLPLDSQTAEIAVPTAYIGTEVAGLKSNKEGIVFVKGIVTGLSNVKGNLHFVIDTGAKKVLLPLGEGAVSIIRAKTNLQELRSFSGVIPRTNELPFYGHAYGQSVSALLDASDEAWEQPRFQNSVLQFDRARLLPTSFVSGAVIIPGQGIRIFTGTVSGLRCDSKECYFKVSDALGTIVVNGRESLVFGLRVNYGVADVPAAKIPIPSVLGSSPGASKLLSRDLELINSFDFNQKFKKPTDDVRAFFVQREADLALKDKPEVYVSTALILAHHYLEFGRLQEAVWTFNKAGRRDLAERLAERIKDFLEHEKIVDIEPNRFSTQGALIVTFRNGLKATLKNDWKDRDQAEVVTYQVDEMLGADVIPITIWRKNLIPTLKRFDGSLGRRELGNAQGALQLWIEDLKDAKVDCRMGKYPKDKKWGALYLVDYFTQQFDRQGGNAGWRPGQHLVGVDNSISGTAELLDGNDQEGYAPAFDLSPDLLPDISDIKAKIRALTNEEIDRRFAWLRNRNVLQDFYRKRDDIVRAYQ